MKSKYFITVCTVIFGIAVMFLPQNCIFKPNTISHLKVGFVYIGDTATAYTNNFYRSQLELEDALGSKVQTVAKFNIKEYGDSCEKAIEDLINQGCELIISTSYGYGQATKNMASKYPEVQFCHATGNLANEAPVLPNFHNFMGRIYEGRYTAGVVAGMKLRELILHGRLKLSDAKIGYVAAYPYPEVISGYTAFFLGVKSIVNEVQMSVSYTNTWSNHIIERKAAEKLIEEGCVIISQHSDTTGPAIACEEASIKKGKTVFHVGYNQSMTDVAPTTSLVSCRINWTPYIIAAAQAVIDGKRIESVVKSNLKGNDSSAGFDKDWIEILGLNGIIAAKGTQEEIQRVKNQFADGKISVFSGNFIGVNIYNVDDVRDFKTPFIENETSSAPKFCYILRDFITVKGE